MIELAFIYDCWGGYYQRMGGPGVYTVMAKDWVSVASAACYGLDRPRDTPVRIHYHGFMVDVRLPSRSNKR